MLVILTPSLNNPIKILVDLDTILPVTARHKNLLSQLWQIFPVKSVNIFHFCESQKISTEPLTPTLLLLHLFILFLTLQ